MGVPIIPPGWILQTGKVLGDSHLELHCPICRVDLSRSTADAVTDLQWSVDSSEGMRVILTLNVDHVCADGTVVTAVPR
jgi:hypothetical protein